MKENVHVNHRERMRKRYKQHGIDNFHDHEVLEMLLYYCYPRCDTNEIAHKMLGEFKTLQNLFESDIDVIKSRLGCTDNIAFLLNYIPEIAKRYWRSKWGDKLTIDNPDIASEYAASLFLGGDQVESFYLISLDAGLRLNNVSLIARGTTDEVVVFTREVARKAIEHRAVSVILTHNHPGGTIAPSIADNNLTSKIKDALNMLDIMVLDHIVVAEDKYFSYAMRGSKFVDGY